MSEESEEWPEHYFELRHARRIKKLEDRLTIPTILLHIGNILFLRETRWRDTSDTETLYNPPHSPRSMTSVSLSYSQLEIHEVEDVDPIAIVYFIYILTLGIALICFSLARLFSPTLNQGLTNEAISTSRCRNAAIITILTMLLVLPFLFLVYLKWAVLLSFFLLYKAYAITVLLNYINLLKIHDNYYCCTNQPSTYPTDLPICNEEDLSFYVDEEDSRSWTGGNISFSDAQENVTKDLPPSYEEAVISSNNHARI